MNHRFFRLFKSLTNLFFNKILIDSLKLSINIMLFNIIIFEYMLICEQKLLRQIIYTLLIKRFLFFYKYFKTFWNQIKILIFFVKLIIFSSIKTFADNTQFLINLLVINNFINSFIFSIINNFIILEFKNLII